MKNNENKKGSWGLLIVSVAISILLAVLDASGKLDLTIHQILLPIYIYCGLTVVLLVIITLTMFILKLSDAREANKEKRERYNRFPSGYWDNETKTFIHNGVADTMEGDEDNELDNS